MNSVEKSKKYEELYRELFDRNCRICMICLMLGGIFWILKLRVLCEQCLICALFSAELQGLRRLHCEYVQTKEYYLPNQLRASYICTKVLYKGNQISVDKGTLFSSWIFVISFWVATFLLWFGCICKKDMESIPISIQFFSCVPSVCWGWGNLVYTAHKKFKHLTWKNCRYYVGFIKKGEKLPKRYKLGNCKIVKENKKFKRRYYTVSTIKTNHIYTKVIYCGKEKINTEFTYCLYEISGTKYIQ